MPGRANAELELGGPRVGGPRMGGSRVGGSRGGDAGVGRPGMVYEDFVMLFPVPSFDIIGGREDRR